MFAIQTHQLTKMYGKNRGIIDLNLEVKQGEVFGFIGPNGAGKSTTIRMLLQLIAPTSGTLSVLGQKVVGDDPEGYSTADLLQEDINRLIVHLKYHVCNIFRSYDDKSEPLASDAQLVLCPLRI
jgi:ABC-type multidrug transport system ATPase subunit